MGIFWLYLLAVFLNAGNLFMQVFFAVMYSDLEADYINPVDLCNKVNVFILPEAGLHAFLTALLLLFGQWFIFLVNVPLLAWNVNKVLKNTHKLDATEIFRTVNTHKKEAFIKLGIHLLLFFYYLYAMIAAIVA
ncbi:ER-derived vesicles protein Erv14p [Trichomonascus vanleenenianus]|uniref:cornichon family protein n=1 Tax=Trichomonascus vanleenenianus TaxID=2268995 RepID=UPI003EC96507